MAIRFSFRRAVIRSTVFLVLALCCVTSTSQAQKPLVSFGVVADVQWSDRDADGPRDYRGSLARLRTVLAALSVEGVAFTASLGDNIDGWETDSLRSGRDIDTVMRAFAGFKGRTVFVAGNHCHRAGASVLRKKWKLKSLYHDFVLPTAKGWHFVVLDANDGAGAEIGEKQKFWLRGVLAAAAKKRERVIVFCHYPLLFEASPNHRLDNPAPILSILDSSRCVVAWIAGHDHIGGYALRNGVHHITVKALVEYPEKPPFAVFKLYADQIVEVGYGAEPMRICRIE